jgi:hypothetical protein|tara:strand:+ start:514 stop:705 length:192 start_codon:yes stop_codon:yes gene_type:complete
MTETFTVSEEVLDGAVEGLTKAIIDTAYNTLGFDDAARFLEALDLHFELLNNQETYTIIEETN